MSNIALYDSNWAGQVFRPQENFIISRARLYCKRSSPTSVIAGNVTMSIKNTRYEEVPIENDIVSVAITGSTITWDTLQWLDFKFSYALVLAVNNSYALIWRAPSATITDNLVYNITDSDSYTRGFYMTSSDSWSTWVKDSNNYDSSFATYGFNEILLNTVKVVNKINFEKRIYLGSAYSSTILDTTRSYNKLSIKGIVVES